MSQTLMMPSPASLGDLPYFGEELKRRSGTAAAVVVHSHNLTRGVIVCCDGSEIQFEDLDTWYNLSRSPIECEMTAPDRFP